MKIPCPLGDHSLRPILIAGIELDRCDQCNVVWLDHRELDAVLRRGGEAGRASTPRPELATRSEIALTCPRCRTPTLQSGSWREIPLSHCHSCHGILLDPAEIARIKRLRPVLNAARQSSPDSPDAVTKAAGIGEAGGNFVEILVHFISLVDLP